MATVTSSIDDLLSGTATPSQPETPEHNEATHNDSSESLYETETETEFSKPDMSEDKEDENIESQSITPETEVDEYGNSKEPENKEIRERLKKQAESLNRKHQAEIEQLRSQLAHQGASPQVQQAAQDFNYNPDAEGDWQQQLAQFVEQTVSNMSTKQQREQDAMREREVHREFETKFHDGMGKFNDFVEVVGAQPVTDAMTMALRAVKDPAAFIYAASKRHGAELQRISQLRDPYSQMVEMGRLEERMRKAPQGTMAPKPVGKTSGDSTQKFTEKKGELSIEDQIRQAESRKMAKMKQYRSGR
jgi:hypothetical protein